MAKLEPFRLSVESTLSVQFSLIDLSRIPLHCVRTITPERGWGGHFHTFTVFLSTLTSTWRYCLLECGKGLFALVLHHRAKPYWLKISRHFVVQSGVQPKHDSLAHWPRTLIGSLACLRNCD